VTDEEFEAGKRNFPIKFRNKEHFYYYRIYRELVGKIPLPEKDEKPCKCCGAGMNQSACHCKIALSYYRVMGDFYVTHLLNMVAENGEISRSHGIRTDVLRLQAEAMGLPIIQPSSSWETYEAEFKKALSDLKCEGVEAGIFGDIDLDAHREWVERVSKESGMQAVLPLWGEKNRENLIEELIEAGFETVIVATKKDVLGHEWLGRRIDDDFVRDISKIKGVDIHLRRRWGISYLCGIGSHIRQKNKYLEIRKNHP